MSTAVASPALVNVWAVFWMQLPVLVLVVAVIIVATTALRRARPEDIPKVFEAFAAGFGRRGDDTAAFPSRRPAAPAHEADEEAR
ncbi:hypothetical protein NMK54_34330 [Nocardia otitidiscaviarum]|uniref:hypothetical protein n=1 Tax=Nocardia otitidiscaviarum TaxID=1823 RepID=UPI0020CC90DB|nr:hypothetical protein [Nocardia otitidiscaviarum]MCP9625225.1 hypothetical protein [Nocardia otitidiscaviarum]